MNFEELQKHLPAFFRQKLDGYRRREILNGCSDSKAFRLEDSGGAAIYLKIAPNDSFPPLREEKERLEWLHGKLPVPQMLAFETVKDKTFLLMTEISGVNSDEANSLGNEAEIIRELAAGLNKIHSLTIENCPFEMRLERKIRLAEERMRKGLVDEEDFDDERTGRTAESLFEELIQTCPADEDLVFTHGDYCLPNIILKDAKLSGFIDLGNAGIADKYQDIALLARSVKYNFGAEWENFLYENLKIKPDLKKIRFYTLLDEFF